jgi:hypothetical protein
MAFKKNIVLSGFPRMSMQKFNGQMMLTPKDSKNKKTNKLNKKSKKRK